MAFLLQAKGDLIGAEPLYRRVLEGYERVLGRSHPDTLGSTNNLALLLQAKGDLAGAEPLYRRALEGRERSLGPSHPDTLQSLNNLAGLLCEKGDLAGAEPLFLRAVVGLIAASRAVGQPHPHLRDAVDNYVYLLAQTGMTQPQILAKLRKVAPEFFG